MSHSSTHSNQPPSKTFVPGGTDVNAGPGQLQQYEASEHMKTTEAAHRVNNPCAPRPSVLYSNSFLPDMVTSKSVYGCSAMSPPYLATDMSTVEPSCNACSGCSKNWDLRIWGYRPVSAPAYACGIPSATSASVSGVESAQGAMQLGVNPLSTVGVGSSSSSRYAYGAAAAAKEHATASMHAACTTGSPADCMTAARQAQNLHSTVASYGMILPTQFLADATEFTGTFGSTRPGGF